MNLNDSEFERRLATLRPALPTPALAESIARELAPRENSLAVRAPTAAILSRSERRGFGLSGLLRGLGWACAGACVALVTIAILERAQPVTAPETAEIESTPLFDHAESSAELLTAQDEGFVYTSGEAPARQVRYNSVERHVWTNASTGARMEVEIPREDVRLMPVAMQ